MFQGIIRELKKEDSNAVEGILGLYWEGDLRDHFVKRVKDFIEHSSESVEQKYRYFVAEDNGEIVGVVTFRKAPNYMEQHSQTDSPVEFYVIAVKYKGRGIGYALRAKCIEEAKKLGFSEALFYSAENHKDSWSFHDNSDFKRVSPANAPNGDPGYIWRMELR